MFILNLESNQPAKSTQLHVLGDLCSAISIGTKAICKLGFEKVTITENGSILSILMPEQPIQYH